MMLMRSSGSKTSLSASRTSSSFSTSTALLLLRVARNEAEPPHQRVAIQVPADAEDLGCEDAVVVWVPVVPQDFLHVPLPAHGHPEERLPLLFLLLFHRSPPTLRAGRDGRPSLVASGRPPMCARRAWRT